jgi:Spy/CpxP family protein refolding chaperone
MLKRALIMAMALAVTAPVLAGTPECDCKNPPPAKQQLTEEQKAQFQQKMDEFETRLKLTDEQKEQARVLREKGKAEFQPLFKKMEALKAEEQKVLNAKVAQATKDKKLEKIQADKEALKNEMMELHKKQGEEFEAILTPKQKKELEKMKKERKEKSEAKKKKCPCSKK